MCDALLLDEDSRSDTYPYMEIEESNVDIGHEATVSKVGEDQLFYLMSRGLTEAQATAMVVAGFIDWRTLLTTDEPRSIDPSATEGAKRFYRAAESE